MDMLFHRPAAAAPALLSAALLAPGCGGDAAPPAAPPGPGPACAGYALRDRGGVRIFAVQPRIEPEHLTSYEAPDGAIQAVAKKPYLVPSEEAQLTLSFRAAAGAP
ncbi:MAG: hypothetical protein IT372_37575 [Polyangiaceae bacterium]|nr:hypothetical protein [Polyangiaceae bacterium]